MTPEAAEHARSFVVIVQDGLLKMRCGTCGWLVTLNQGGERLTTIVGRAALHAGAREGSEPVQLDLFDLTAVDQRREDPT